MKKLSTPSVARMTDHRARVTLFDDFADHLVIMERVNDSEIRIHKVKVTSSRVSLKELLDRITPENIHHGVDTGPAVGREVL